MSPLRSELRKPYGALVFFVVATLFAGDLQAQDSKPASAPTTRPDSGPTPVALPTPPPPPSPVATIDAEGRFLVRGKPVFINGWYSDGDPGRLRRLADGGFNAVLDYGLTARPVAATRAYLAEAERLGVMVIAAVHDVYPSATHRNELGEWKGNDQILTGVMGVLRGSPAVVAYYVHDELSVEKLAEMQGFSRRVRELDPTRPLVLVHETPALCGVFGDTADVFGIDHYPIPKDGPGAFAPVFDAARASLDARRPLWAVLQNFAWYQHRTALPPVVAGDQTTERARLPMPAEWTANRPPTRDETRAMHYVALARGAQGLLWWCLYNLDFLPDRAERWEDAVRLSAETNALAPYLLGADGPPVVWSDPRVLARIKRLPDGRRILIAVNTAPEPVRVVATVDPDVAAAAAAASRPDSRATTRPESAPATPQRPASTRSIDVLFESRLVRVVDGALIDFFAPYERHVYRLDA